LTNLSEILPPLNKNETVKKSFENNLNELLSDLKFVLTKNEGDEEGIDQIVTGYFLFLLPKVNGYKKSLQLMDSIEAIPSQLKVVSYCKNKKDFLL
jgi:hypothetical protein